MREILFRGKRKDNGEWVEGYFCRKYFPELPHDRCVIQNKTEYTKEWRPDYMVAEVIPETIGQYTGLTDKNGKKIFEGDIVNCKTQNYSFKKCTVKYEKCFARYIFVETNGYEYPMQEEFEFEIIGNIHDNPELLVREQQ